MGRKFNSFALLSLAGRAGSDPFVKIRGLIEEMIAKLEKQALEEATQEAFCQEENAKSKKKRDTVNAEVDKYSARVEKAKAGVETLELEISDLQKQLSEMDTMLQKATKVRGEENALYKKNQKDQSESITAVEQAIQVLQEFYGGASFVQQPAFGGAKSDSSNTIISFLEVAQSDFSTLLAETEADEKEAVEAYEQLMQESAVSKATKEASIKGKNSEVQSLKVAIENTGSDLSNANKELDAIMEYIEKLKPQCESKAMSYAERKAARDAEISGLKEALEILDSEAPEFIQTRKQVFLGRE
jgi:predicted  nucleic acid-binding Zn-ribbon protein